MQLFDNTTAQQKKRKKAVDSGDEWICVVLYY